MLRYLCDYVGNNHTYYNMVKKIIQPTIYVNDGLIFGEMLISSSDELR